MGHLINSRILASASLLRLRPHSQVQTAHGSQRASHEAALACEDASATAVHEGLGNVNLWLRLLHLRRELWCARRLSQIGWGLRPTPFFPLLLPHLLSQVRHRVCLRRPSKGFSLL